jgi:hypothetical protein
MLSHEGARPSTVVTGSSPVVVRTARRLTTSAIETKCEHNRSIDRAPHTAPESPPAQLSLRVAGPFSELSQPRFHGPGAGAVTHTQPLSTAIARGESFTPTRLARAPPVANLFPPGAGKPSPKMSLLRGTSTGSPGQAALSRDLAVKGRLTRLPAKGSAFRRTRGAFHQRAHPRKGAPSPRRLLSPEYGGAESRRLFIRCVFLCRDQAEDRNDSESPGNTMP